MRARWTVVALLVAAGCFDQGTTGGAPCVPACRDGYTCVYGICLSRCNPPCGPGTRCAPLDEERATCVPDLPVDAGTKPRDVPVGADATTPDASDSDLPDSAAPPRDASDDGTASDDHPAMDALTSDTPTSDTPIADSAITDTPIADSAMTDIPMTDTPATDVADAGARDAGASPDAGSCGRAGEACCAGISCLAGSLCVRERCEAYAPASGECQSSQECPLMRACSGGRACGTGMNWRWCYQCLPPTGVARFGERCNTYTDCATGVCNNGRCTHACDPGPAGDGQCVTAGVRSGRCAQIIYGLTPVSDGGVPRAWQTLGACEQGCARNGDCATGTACIPISDELQDRVVFICSATRATAVAGTPCMWGDDCQSGMCIAGANPMGGAACSAPCTVDGDCPTTAPVCAQIRLFTSNGTAIPTRGCLPRR